MPSLRSFSQDHPCDVVVIGAGFSGTLVAVRVAELTDGAASVRLVERRSRFACGVAYGTDDPSHLLNVPAGRMGAYDGDPEGFLRWCTARPDRCRSVGVGDLHPGSFVPRKLYGEYLGDVLDEARRRYPNLGVVQGEVTDLVPQPSGRFGVTMGDGRSFPAGKIVLALGNFPPGDPKLRDQHFHTSPRYLTDPWAEATTARLSEPGDVLILGSGLTGLDLLLSLAKRKREGVIHLISRRGLFPLPHAACAPCPPVFSAERLPGTARAAFHELRQGARRAQATGGDWRAVIDGLRPHTQAIWRSWDWVEKGRFLRHLRAYWEPHRHRASAEALAVKGELEAAGRLVCYRGRVDAVTDAGDALEVQFSARDRPAGHHLRVGYVVNCTGPECNYHKLKDLLVLQMFYRGLITPDPLFLGLDAGAGGIIYNVYGEQVLNLYTLGSPQKGRLLETTAVPELRVQAETLARRLSRELAIVQSAPGVGAGVEEIPAYEI